MHQNLNWKWAEPSVHIDGRHIASKCQAFGCLLQGFHVSIKCLMTLEYAFNLVLLAKLLV